MVKKLKAPPRLASAADRAAQRTKKEQPPQAIGPEGPVITLPPMTVAVVNLLLEALGQLPHGRVEGVINVIRSETQQQLRALEAAKKPPALPPPTSESSAAA